MLFILYTLVGSLFFFFCLLLLYYECGTFSFSLLAKVKINYMKQLFLFFFSFIAFSVKIPMFPFHIWLPEAHVEAPSVGSVILAGILLKLGCYGFIRIVYPCFTEAVFFFYPFIYTLSLLGILYPAFVAMRQIDLKRIVAYSSICHMNLIVLGLFLYSLEGLIGGCFLMLAHGIVSALFFFLVGFVYDRYGSRLLIYYGGLCKIMPFFSFCLFFASLCNIGLPGTCNFIGEFLIFIGLFLHNKVVFFLSLISVILSPIYSFFFFNRMCFGNLTGFVRNFQDLNFIECLIILPLLFLCLVLGFFPFFCIDVLTSTSLNLLEKIK